MKPTTKKLLISNYKVTLLLYWLIYLIKTFVEWRFTNPFYWLFHIHEFEPMDRLSGLGMVVFWQLFQLFIIWGILEDRRKAAETKNAEVK